MSATFRDIRNKLNLSQEDFARLLGVRLNSVSRWERGETIPTFKISQIENLLSVLEKAGVSLKDIPES